MSVDISVLRSRLAEAEAAHHSLLLGQSAVSISGGGTSVTYTAAQADTLAGYIATLRAKIATAAGGGGSARRPIYV